MKLSSAIILFTFLIAACGGPAERMKDIETQQASPSPTPGEPAISGSFNLTGAGANGADPYGGLLTIAPQGDVYSIRWSLSRGNRTGTGVQIGSALAASFAPAGGGQSCGAVLYAIGANGALQGRIVKLGEEVFGTETAQRTKGNSLIGEYTLEGETADGLAYSGSLKVKRNGEGYQFEWTRTFSDGKGYVSFGFGTWNGRSAASGFGGTQCGFALYEVESNGNLKGYWGGQKAVTIGSETAKRQ